MRRAPWLLALMLTTTARPAAAAAGSRTPFALALAPELSLTAGGLALYGLLAGFVEPALGGGLPCRTADDGRRCDPAALRPLDRHVVGRLSQTWEVVSTAGEAAGLAGAALAVAGDALWQSAGRPLSDAGTDLLVLVEVFTVANAANQLLKYAVRRPRPALYRLYGARGGEELLSFPSGHTLATAVGMAGWASIFALRHPHSSWRWLPIGVGTALTGVVAYGRVAAGRHFYSDVLAGALLGGMLGYALPALHRRAPGLSLDVHVGADGLRFGLEGHL